MKRDTIDCPKCRRKYRRDYCLNRPVRHYLRATEALILAGGEVRNRHQFSQHNYRTRGGHISNAYAYRAVARAIARGEVELHVDGTIRLTPRVEQELLDAGREVH